MNGDRSHAVQSRGTGVTGARVFSLPSKAAPSVQGSSRSASRLRFIMETSGTLMRSSRRRTLAPVSVGREWGDGCHVAECGSSGELRHASACTFATIETTLAGKVTGGTDTHRHGRPAPSLLWWEAVASPRRGVLHVTAFPDYNHQEAAGELLGQARSFAAARAW